MRGLFTADWQAEWANLKLCTQAWSQALELAKEHALEFICVAGDLKRAYNPVDVRVIKWWQRSIEKAVKLGVRVIIVNGNHDRIGQTEDQKNWLPVLSRAGAEVYDEPDFCVVEGGRLAMLPFCSKPAQFRQWVTELVRQSRKESDVLVFHADLKYAMYNMTGQKSEGRISVKDLHSERYRYCFGGHIHLPQQLNENTFYVGSPFASDWGEANQKKSFRMVVGVGMEKVPSKIPGWYDDTWPGFPKNKKTWDGANVRIHVGIAAGTDYSGLLTRAREEAERKYPGANIHTVAEFEEKKQTRTHVRITDPDSVKIREYIRQQEFVEEKAMAAYLLQQLEKVGGTKRAVEQVRFESSSAKNFLSYEDLELKFEKGLTVVSGRNGMGKTNMFQSIPVALFGTTFKGQKHDEWARNRTTEKAEVQVTLRDARKRQIRVTRTRRPGSLDLRINDVPHNTGLRSDQKDATAGAIEQVTGYTWQTLANSVFVDQEVTRAFLAGTKKQRTDLLARFQNLERFEKALQWIREDKRQTAEHVIELETELGEAKRLVENLEVECEELDKQHREDLTKLKKEHAAAQEVLDKAKCLLKNNTLVRKKKVAKLNAELEDLNASANYDKEIGALKFEQQTLVEWKDGINKLKGNQECPTCYQPMDKELLQQMVAKWNAKLERIRKDLTKKLELRAKHLQEKLELETQIEEIEGKTVSDRQTISLLETRLRFEHEKLVAFHNTEMREEDQRKKKKRELKEAKRSVEIKKQALADLRESQEFYKFAETAMSRDGIPAFLNRAMVPELNAAADYYANLFTDKAIQVRFGWDGEFVADVVNTEGGEDYKAQSKGESALAGLIAAFSLRETAPKTNVVVLDEPGEGLDEQNARKVARALLRLTRKFESVYVTTHNVHILGELEGERTIRVVKKNGCSLAKYV